MINLYNKKVFIFDLDGVITSTDAYHFEAWSKAADKIDISLGKEFEHNIRGVGREDSLKLILKKYNKKISDIEFNYILDYKNNYYVDLLSNFGEENIFDGVIELLNYLKNKNVKIILASASKNAILIIKKINLEKYFDNIIDASTLSKTKPDPEIFLESVKISGFKKEECIVIEDSQSGIDASQSMNLDTIAYEPRGDMLSGFTIKVRSHREILNLLKEGENVK